jgi:hypothetical protein
MRPPALLVCLAAWLVCAAPVPVRSQDSTDPVRSAADLAQEKARQQRQNLPFTKGTLTDIDYVRHELRVQTMDGLQTFTYTLRTYIFRNKDKITIDKLKAGEIVALRFTTDDDGVRTIVRIKAYGAPTPEVPSPGPTVSGTLAP